VEIPGDRAGDRQTDEEHMSAPLRRLTAPAALLACMLASAASFAQTNLPAEEFTAFAVNMGTYTVGSTASLVITVNRWSTAEEREKLMTTVREKGPEGLLKVVQGFPRLGSLRTPQTVGYELKFAIQDPAPEGGRRVLIATDRPISFTEATNRPPTIDYPFTVIDMQLKPDGTGSGTMSLAARIIPAGKNIVVENFDTQPIRLNKVESRKLKKD
jgi:hypothetical protein